MEPIGNEPKGWEENKHRNANDFELDTDKETKSPEIDQIGGDLSGNAAGNVADEEIDSNEEWVNYGNEDYKLKTDDPRGFMGDYTEPQHDE